VCGLADARALVLTALAGGERVSVCATHELVHRRSGVAAATIAELRAMLGEKRKRSERRESFLCDELGARLTAGFAGERRTGGERRR
jgi:hypothetical protein